LLPKLRAELTGIFLRDKQGRRPVNRGVPKFDSDSNPSDLILLYEYFHGDTGQGLGASHQAGWTVLVTKLLQQSNDRSKAKRLNAAGTRSVSSLRPFRRCWISATVTTLRKTRNTAPQPVTKKLPFPAFHQYLTLLSCSLRRDWES
jgi:hypothetical protein